MSRYFKDEGIVVWKKNLLGGHRLVSVLSKHHGRIVLKAYGIRKLTSRRLPDLETGNYIYFSFYKKTDYYYLSETTLIYGYSKIKKSVDKLSFLFLLLGVVNKILPENQKEEEQFSLILQTLKEINNNPDFNLHHLNSCLSMLLIKSGFVTKEQVKSPYFDPIRFVEDLVGQKFKKVSG